MSGRNISRIVLCMIITLSSLTAQHGRGSDPRYSVFGPPKIPEWKFQLGYLSATEGDEFSFNFYRQDQRDKTVFFSISDNSYDYTNQYRVREVTGGVVLFPINDDDRYQLDIGGTFDEIISSEKTNSVLFSRFTYRPTHRLWLRVGFEYFDGYDLANGPGSYTGSSLQSVYLSGKYRLGGISPIALLAHCEENGLEHNHLGAGAFLEGPSNTFFFAGNIFDVDTEEAVQTIALGRWASFRPDNLPSAVFIWKHRSDYDFQLGALFHGRHNLFVKPAAMGMVNGLFISNIALRANSQLRQRKLAPINNDYENSDYSLFYIHLDQQINNGANHVGFTAVHFYMLFSGIEFSVLSDPVIGIFYTSEVSPEFDPMSFSLVDVTDEYFSYQLGIQVVDKYALELVHIPDRSEIILAFSYVLNPPTKNRK